MASRAQFGGFELVVVVVGGLVIYTSMTESKETEEIPALMKPALIILSHYHCLG